MEIEAAAANLIRRQSGLSGLSGLLRPTAEDTKKIVRPPGMIVTIDQLRVHVSMTIIIPETEARVVDHLPRLTTTEGGINNEFFTV